MKADLLRWVNHPASKLALGLSIGLLTIACATEPQATAASADAAATSTPLAANAAPAVSEENRIECRKEQVTGSNVSRRVCRSVATWNALARAERRMTDEFTRQTSQAEGLGNRSGLPASPTAVGPMFGF